MSRRSIGLALATLLALAACAPVTTRTTFPPLGSTPGPAGDATADTKQAIVQALAAKGLVAIDAVRTYRPPEGPLLAAAPRSVLQVDLTDDPDHGYIVVYALDSPAAAIAAARDQLLYLAQGVGGGALLPPGTHFVVRPRDSTVVFFHWLPANSPDPRTPEVADIISEVTSAITEP